ncbi:PadR family transcriptional regulator [Rhodococcoides kyotonense]|uniref:PadR family transcriptional regulator n=1 Tax=Rhodococcoides kyotonense TaxID=398843 RepID=UPI001FE8FF77|nr:PadR family transcriptional regulator [Rhodococcus kyotonensis]
MSSIRLFILGSLAQRGDMHGHQLRLLAEEERIHLWTDISVGGLYGALKRLHAEGLIADIRIEQAGNFPARQVYGITDSGREALAQLRSEALDHFSLKPDPFDLALTRLDPTRLDVLPDVIAARVQTLKQHLLDAEAANARAGPYLSLAERYALSHRETRLRAEIDWHENLVDALSDIVADERTRVLPPLPNSKDGFTT